jgi:hypothetical protein
VVAGGSGDVDPLGNLGVRVAVELDAEEAAGLPVAGDPHGDLVAARLVGLWSSASKAMVTGSKPAASRRAWSLPASARQIV